MPWPLLRGLLQHLHRRSSGQPWLRANGGDAGVRRLCRAIRARAYRDHLRIDTYMRWLLNAEDPPRCRCGKPGTRIAAGETFCRTCGPTAFTQQRMHTHHVHLDHAHIERAHETITIDQRESSRTRLRQTKQGHK